VNNPGLPASATGGLKPTLWALVTPLTTSH